MAGYMYFNKKKVCPAIIAGYIPSTTSPVTITLHFPSNLQSVIEGIPGYPNFGAPSGSVTILFDLPATS